MILREVKAYFLYSEDRYKAALLLLGIILGTVGLIQIASLALSFEAAFITALTEMNSLLFIESTKQLLALGLAFCVTSKLTTMMTKTLEIRWRSWLTNKINSKYIAAENQSNYLELSRTGKIENPASRIQHDIGQFIHLTLELGINFMENMLSAATFIRMLWFIGGSLSISLLGTTVTIPGYLVWSALLFAASTIGLTHWMGSRLTTLTDKKENLEADYRAELESINQDAESIALDRGEKYYGSSLQYKFKLINENSYETMPVKANLSSLNDFLREIAYITPYIIAAPLCFAKPMDYAQLTQMAMAFAQVQYSFTWFSNTYEYLSKLNTHINRIEALDRAISNESPSARNGLHYRNNQRNEISIRNLNIAFPTRSDYMISDLSVTFKSGEHTLIKSPSGLGKSTLFKVIAKTWKHGDGTISRPKDKIMCFLPQTPHLPNDTLRGVLAYPQSSDAFTDHDYEEALRKVDMSRYIERLDEHRNWSSLSGGQKQRISFARTLLKKPDWLFLDEATASLDEESEEQMYQLIKDELPKATMISIAHRSTVAKFHDKTIDLRDLPGIRFFNAKSNHTVSKPNHKTNTIN